MNPELSEIVGDDVNTAETEQPAEVVQESSQETPEAAAEQVETVEEVRAAGSVA
jgi:hypothetical protein